MLNGWENYEFVLKFSIYWSYIRFSVIINKTMALLKLIFSCNFTFTNILLILLILLKRWLQEEWKEKLPTSTRLCWYLVHIRSMRTVRSKQKLSPSKFMNQSRSCMTTFTTWRIWLIHVRHQNSCWSLNDQNTPRIQISFDWRFLGKFLWIFFLISIILVPRNSIVCRFHCKDTLGRFPPIDLILSSHCHWRMDGCNSKENMIREEVT